MSFSLYDSIGKTYDSTRCADSKIVEALLRIMNPCAEGKYLDIACGSGNYTVALERSGLRVEGLDISAEMLAKARSKSCSISWHHGDARRLPFRDGEFHGALCVLATHHIGDFETAFQEACRVICSGRFVIFTSTPEQMLGYWLWHYFPLMMEDASRRMAPYSRIERALRDAGFVGIERERFFITDLHKDAFLHVGKYKPELYLDEKVRAGISAFHVSADRAEIVSGLERLRQDIDSGEVKNIIRNFECDEGDYLFVVGKKSEAAGPA